MNKRKQHIYSFTVVYLCVLLFILAACNAPASSPGTNASPNATETSAAATAFVQVTADTYPNIVGTYSGSYQAQGKSASTTMHLTIMSETAGVFAGTCVLGAQSYPVSDGTTVLDTSAFNFTINSNSSNPITFSGDQQRDGSLTGTYSSSNGEHDTWSVKKA